MQTTTSPKPFWNPWLAGVALGITLLATFILTGHGLGATGFTTRLSAWLGLQVAPEAMKAPSSAPANTPSTCQVIQPSRMSGRAMAPR